MKTKKNLKLFLVTLGVTTCLQLFGQNIATMYVEKIDAGSIVFPAECTPEDMVIVINSSIPDLKFESNIVPSDEFYVFRNETENQYFICHEKIY